jgi:four helix bundle protein
VGLQQSLRRNAGDAGEVAFLDHAPAHDHDRQMKIYFDHEKLDVYQHSLKFCAFVGELLEKIPAKAAAKDQLDRASTSIPLNIAEGNGKFSNPDRSRFFEISRGSSLECAACLDVLLARKIISTAQVTEGKEQLVPVVNMLVGLLKRFSDRAEIIREEASLYAVDQEHEQEQERG